MEHDDEGDIESQLDSSRRDDTHPFEREIISDFTNIGSEDGSECSLSVKESVDSSKALRILDCILINLHPIHFVTTMGIGITSGIMYNFPIEPIRNGMQYVGIVYFFIALFTYFAVHFLFLLKYILLSHRYDNITIVSLLKNETLNVFFGAEVMGLTTIINMIHFLKPSWWIFAYTLWWINISQALISAIGITFVMISINDFNLEKINASILLPIVTLTVGAASGSVISQSFIHVPKLFLAQNIVCFMFWSIAIILSIFFLSIYFHRLFLCGLPSQDIIFTSFIPIGILGQGSWAIQLIFKNFGDLAIGDQVIFEFKSYLDFSVESLYLFKFVLEFFSIIISLFFSSFGIFLTLLSLIFIYFRGLKSKWMRTMWASTFPIGTIALSFNEMYRSTNNTGFLVIGTIYSFSIIVVTTYCMICTLVCDIPYKKIRKIIYENDK